MRKSFLYYDLILVFFAASLLISNLAATKVVAFGPIIADGGAVLFPLVYILNDVLTEVYGYKYARRAIWTAFGVMLTAVVAFTIVRYLPSASDYTAQSSYEAILGFFPRIVVASLAAYLVGSFVNSYILAKMKVRFGKDKLWARLIGSTAVGELLDTILFGLIAFGGIFGFNDMVIFILTGWLFKTGVEIIFLPVSYRVIALLKAHEHSDAVDKKTDFNPMRFNV